MVKDIVESIKKYRIVDLSAEVKPNVLKVNGEFIRGNQIRKFNLQQFINAEDKTYMHFIESESHIGTHVEGPSHLREGLKSCMEIPLEKFMGEAIVLKFEAAGTEGSDESGFPIKPEHLTEVKKDDIVLMWSPGGAYVTSEAAEYLASKHIKMLGVQGVQPDDPRAYKPNSNIKPATHIALLENEIPIIEGLINLDKIREKRVFFIGLPLKIAHLDSSWIRAIALESNTAQ
ncbi:cyclase family protein [Candidatus Bathyarchaeota archaeon]|nr:cyclase family protein [Candidatus Bathyarchaeota archaeon]